MPAQAELNLKTHIASLLASCPEALKKCTIKNLGVIEYQTALHKCKHIQKSGKVSMSNLEEIPVPACAGRGPSARMTVQARMTILAKVTMPMKIKSGFVNTRLFSR